MKDIFYFESMLTPKIITFVYWLLLLFAALAQYNVIFPGVTGIEASGADEWQRG